MRDFIQERIQSFAFVISVSIAVCLSLTFIPNSINSEVGANEIDIESRINPNTAPVASLIRLPDIGLSRAGAIEAYREQYHIIDSKNRVFQDINDLQKVKGIGPKTTQNISQWLTFE